MVPGYLISSHLPGRYAMQAMKQMEPQVKQALQSFPKTVIRTDFDIKIQQGCFVLHIYTVLSPVCHCRHLEEVTTEVGLNQK